MRLPTVVTPRSTSAPQAMFVAPLSPSRRLAARGFANMRPPRTDQMVSPGFVCAPRLPTSPSPRLPVELQEPPQPRRFEPRDRNNVPDYGAAQVEAPRTQGPVGAGSQEELQFAGRHRE